MYDDQVPPVYSGSTGVDSFSTGNNGPTIFNFHTRDADDIFAEFFGFTNPFEGMGGGVRGCGMTGSGVSSGIFGDDLFFGEGNGISNRTIPYKAPPIENILPCSLEELYNGTTKKIKIFRNILDTSGSVLSYFLQYLSNFICLINFISYILLALTLCVFFIHRIYRIYKKLVYSLR